MTSKALAVKRKTPLVPTGKAMPASFSQALLQGWEVAHEKTTLSIDGRRREGMLTLKRRGFAKLLNRGADIRYVRNS